MLISVHLPKTAGTSFAATLEKYFGDKLLKDYAGYGLRNFGFLNVHETSSLYEKYRANLKASLKLAVKDLSRFECIHGHFFPVKYLLMGYKQQAKFVTWMRNPVDRVLSHYYYCKRSYDPKTSPIFHQKVVEENWTIERFCLGSEIRNHYWEKFWGFPLEYFDFVGITEFYDEDLAYFARQFLNADTETTRLNVGEGGGKPYSIDDTFRKEIESFHDRDMALYQRALEMRLARRSTT